MESTDKTRENRLRRVAARRGLRLEKSRRRDRSAIGFGGYRLIDESSGRTVLGESAHAFDATMDEVEAALDGGLSAAPPARADG